MPDWYEPRPLELQSPPFDLEEDEMYHAGLVYCYGCSQWVRYICDDENWCDEGY